MADDILSVKQCTGCLEFKPTKCFSPHVNTKDKLQPKCKACRNALQKKTKQTRSLDGSAAVGYDRQKYMEKYSAERRRADKRAYYQANKALVVDRALGWAKRNPSVMASRAMHRLALKRKATPSWANLAAIDVLYIEAKRREIETGVKWHVDHIVPLKSKLVCGLHVEANLAVLTASENIAKSNRYWPDMP